MNTKDIEYFKDKLTAEKLSLEANLNDVARKDPTNANGWEATSGEIDVDTADENVVADKFEEYEGNRGVTEKLEGQLNEVNAALDRITKGTYGICEICNKPIEKERLLANPSSRISIKHQH